MRLLNRVVQFCILIILTFFLSSISFAQNKYQGYVEDGGFQFSTTNPAKVQRSYPNATITVYSAGTTNLVNIYSDATLTTSKSNPFTADSKAYYYFYTAPGRYDLRFSGTGITTPFTLSDIAVGSSSNYSYNPLYYGAACDGFTSDTSAFSALLTVIGSSRATIILPKNTSCVLDSITLPSNINLDFDSNNGSILVNVGQTVTIQSAFVALRNRIFFGSGTISFSGNKKLGEVYPEWWGAIPDNSTPSNTAFQSAINAISTAGGGTLALGVGSYRITNLTYGGDNLTVRGLGPAVSILRTTNTTGDTLYFNGTSPDFNYKIKVEGVEFYPAVTKVSGAEIRADYVLDITLKWLFIHDCYQQYAIGDFTAPGAGGASAHIYMSDLVGSNYTIGVWFKRALDIFTNAISWNTNNNSANARGMIVDSGCEGNNFTGVNIVNSANIISPNAGNRAILIQHSAGAGVWAVPTPPRFNYFTGCYFDSHEIGLVSTAGIDFKFTNSWFSGTTGGAFITNSTLWTFTNNTFLASTAAGLALASGSYLNVVDCTFITGAVGIDVYIDANHVRLEGNQMGNNLTNLGTPLAIGILLKTGVDHIQVKNNNLCATSVAPITINNGPLGPTKIVKENDCYVTENSGGPVSIASGSTTINVSHGLSLQPGLQHITITPTNVPTNANVQAKVTSSSASNFTITLTGDPGASGFQFYWRVRIE